MSIDREIYIHPSSIVDKGASIGEGTRIWHWVHVSSEAEIGRNCSLGQNVFVGNKVFIGDNVKIQNNVSIYDNVTLEDDVFCGPSMVFTNVYNPRSSVSRKEEYRKLNRSPSLDRYTDDSLDFFNTVEVEPEPISRFQEQKTEKLNET